MPTQTPSRQPADAAPAPKRTMIADMQPSQFVHGVFVIQNCQLAQTKGGKPYIKCLLSDKTGRTPGRMWNASEEIFSGLPTDGFVWVEGQSQPYQGEMQVIINQMYGVDPSPQDLLDLLPASKFDPEKMFAELRQRVGSMQDKALLALADAYLDDAALMEKFKRAPAAQNLHHAFLSGLLEHTLQLLRLADAVCPHYPQINRDVVLMGLFLHDLGKCIELSWESGFNYTDDGQLVGHIARGVVMLEKKAEQVRAAGVTVGDPLLMVLNHIILSHHGKPEFGALKQPATPEAIMVSLLDNADAKLYMAVTAARADIPGGAAAGGNFTDKQWALDGVRLYRPDPTKAV